MTKKRVTLAHVAEEAGVSRTTASFVMSGRTDMRISEDSQHRVRAAAERLGYRPNQTARSLRTNVTRTLGLVSDTIASTQYAGEIIRGASDEAQERGLMAIVAETQADPRLERDLIQELLDRQVDGFVYAIMGPRHSEPPEALRHSQVVLLQCLGGDFDVPRIIPDDFQAGREAARALVEAGHLEGVHAIGAHHRTEAQPDGIDAGNERMRGAEEVLAEHGTAFAGVWQCVWEPQDGYRATRALLDSGSRPRALVCANDRVAMGAYQALQEDGVGIPEDVSVVSFDNSELAAWLRPGLSSVNLPYYEMGRLSVRLLLDPAAERTLHHVPMLMRERESVARVGGSAV
ncbi:LacI family DNA-binding transcriptional regulator [Nocardiopsis nanhaiensis]